MKNFPFCPRAHDAGHVRDVQRARGSCGSLEKPQASARVDVPTAPSKRRKIVILWSRTGSSTRCALEMLPSLLKASAAELEKQGVHWTPSRRGDGWSAVGGKASQVCTSKACRPNREG